VPKLTDQEIEDLLSHKFSGDVPGHGLLHLATVASDGSPEIVPLGYHYQDRTIYLTARAKTRWLANIRRNPRVAVVVDHGDISRRRVTIRGDAKVLYEPGQEKEWVHLRVPQRTEVWTGPRRLPDGRNEWNYLEAYTIMTWDEPRACVAIPRDEAKVTSWRMADVGEYLSETWSPGYYHTPPKKFRITQLGPSADEWRVVEED
jgi:nitroimidazol reductase NimA-like FMN-containing flavoprotein (pyridoxamine 5'-phosphate oxidase superfamily)